MRSKKANHRIKYLVHINRVVYLAILEPLVNKTKIEGYRKFLGFQYCLANTNGKIWCFWNHLDQVEVIANEEQHITIKFKDRNGANSRYVSVIYAECTDRDRRDLWDSMENISRSINDPWCVGGDFNDIMDPDEKLGGKPHRANKCFDFISTMEACGLSDLGFVGRNAMWRLQCKLKVLSKNLRPLGIFMSREDLNREHTKYVKWLGMQDALLKQKTRINWFKDGDYNSKYFHSVLRDRRKRLLIHRIKDHRENWIEGDNMIARAAIRHYKNLFNMGQPNLDSGTLDCIPKLITEEDNDMLHRAPVEDEIKNVVFSMRADRSVGPDGFNVVVRVNLVLEKNFPFTYLGCPIYIGRKKISYFDDVVTKVVKRLNGWQGKMLTYGGKMVLIKSVLQSLPIYTLSAINPPIGTIYLLKKHFDRFFWGFNENRDKHHWRSWKNLCVPKDEGGICIRNMDDISKTLAVKRWWRFRTNKSLWADFMKAKYCHRVHPSVKAWTSGNSQAWKFMVNARHVAEPNILWKINSGSCNMWWDNWCEKGPLAILYPDHVHNNNTKVMAYIDGGNWNMNKLREALPEHIVLYIANIPIGDANDNDYAVWNITQDGQYTNSSA
ncbi:hypothetical protein MTR67_047596 [Solanum verrucosum]|uniref:Uncharacterized protein n=1 Tax=Solanum verrucosum TaxID=315347 RepID=A0AAF0ZWM5_SOLVR|nr:hypothetical protein MTR67_047596 [Solanum verrucosum]